MPISFLGIENLIVTIERNGLMLSFIVAEDAFKVEMIPLKQPFYNSYYHLSQDVFSH